MHLSADRRALVGPAVLLGLGVLLGALTGADPRIGLAGAMAVAFVTIVMADLSVGLCLYALLAFLNIVPNVGGSFLSFDKVAGALLALSWMATVVSRRQVRRAFVGTHPQFFAVLLFFLTWVFITLLWAEHAGTGVEPATRYLLSVFLLLIVFTAVRKRRHVRWILGAFVASSTLSGAYGIVVPQDPNAGERLRGTIGEPNQLATVLVAGVVLALGLAIVARRNPLLRLVWIGAAGICLISTFLTLSRAGLIALIAAMFVAVIVAGRWRPLAASAAALVIITLVGFFAFVATSSQTQRVTEINGGSGRQDIWTVGWRMVQDEPVRGIGVGQFPTSAVHYLIAPGTIQRSDLIVDTPKVAHNIYLHVLAEMGIIGLIPFLIILFFPLACALRAARTFARRGDPDMDLLSRAVFVGLCAMLTADFFASEQFSKQLWLLLGLGPALLAMAQRTGSSEDEENEQAEPAPPGPLAPSRLEPRAVVS